MVFPPHSGGGMDLSPPFFRGSGGEFPPRILEGRGGNLRCPPPTFWEGNPESESRSTGGDKIASPPRFFASPPPHTGGEWHFSSPPRQNPIFPPRGDGGGTKSDISSPPVFRDHGGGEFFVPPRFPRGRGGTAKNRPPPYAGGEYHLCPHTHVTVC